jgi:hypothetical protein
MWLNVSENKTIKWVTSAMAIETADTALLVPHPRLFPVRDPIIMGESSFLPCTSTTGRSVNGSVSSVCHRLYDLSP